MTNTISNIDSKNKKVHFFQKYEHLGDICFYLLKYFNLINSISTLIMIISAFFYDNNSILFLSPFFIVFFSMFLFAKKINNKTYYYLSFLISLVAFSIFIWVVKPYEIVIISSILITILAGIILRFSLSIIITIILVTSQIIFIKYNDINVLFIIEYSIFILILNILCNIISHILVKNLKETSDEITSRENDVLEKQEFISKLSHRIRTPLNNILAIANLLSDTILEKNRPLLDSIIASVKNITDIAITIDDETTLANVVCQNSENDESTFDLLTMIFDLAEISNTVKVKINVPENIPQLVGDAVKIRRIFLCIFDFFGKYSNQDICYLTININKVRLPELQIKYRFDISSKINVNIPENENVFELDIVNQLANSLGGNMKCRFDDDKTFIYFNLCFKKEIENENSTNNQKYFSKSSKGFIDLNSSKNISDAKILIVEDNVVNQKVMVLSLEKYVFSTDIAFNGQEAILKYQKNDYDIILMDIQMPVMDGYEATRKIREIELSTKRHIPIIAVTANTLASDKERCFRNGMDDYVSKPFHIDEVVKKITKLLNS
ncbi:MAG: response regulator [Bacteroidales bacterium]|nr:response regulator [Bacteroidales bacterium]